MDLQQHVFFAASQNAPADQYLVSPVLTVDGELVVSFKHAYAFEFDEEKSIAMYGGVATRRTASRPCNRSLSTWAAAKLARACSCASVPAPTMPPRSLVGSSTTSA